LNPTSPSPRGGAAFSPVRPADHLLSRATLWTPCVAMLLLSFISLVDRSILSILSPVMLSDLHLSAEQYGIAIFVFSICYMLANPIWGFCMDRLGLFTAIALAVGLWSFASGAHAFLSGFVGLCCARAVLGFGEGAAFPAGLKTVTETLPAERRSFGLGLAYSGGSLGAALSPMIIVPLAHRYGWRSTFILSALVGFAWITGWWLLRRAGLYRRVTTPATHAAVASVVPSASRWNRGLFATAAVYGLGAAPIAFGLYAGPLYLNRVLHQPQSALGHLLWIPPAGWETGYLVWGWVADRRRARSTSTQGSSPLALFSLFAAGSLGMAAIPFCAALPHAVAVTLVALFLIMFLSGGFIVISLAHGATTQSASNSGFLAGFSISGWSLTTGVLMWIVGRMFDRGMFAQSFWLVAVLPCLGVALWWLLLRGQPTAPGSVAGDEVKQLPV
jgi:ACS family hexuronate transporter-like MFS transporter